MKIPEPVAVLFLVLSTACESPVAEAINQVGCSGNGAEIQYSVEQLLDSSPRTYRDAYRVGEVEGPPGIAWGRIADAAMDTLGNVYVVDAMEKSVFVHNIDSGLVRSIGRAGSGPAEFQYPVALGLQDTVLTVFDPRLWRVSTFSTSGEYRSIGSPPPEPRMGQVWEGTFTPDGDLMNLSYAQYQQSLTDELGGRRVGNLRGITILQAWAGGEWAALQEVPGPEVYVNMDEGAISDVPFARRPLWDAVEGGGFWYADNSAYRLDRFSPSGQRVCRIVLPTEPPAVNESERRAFLEASDIENKAARQNLVDQRRSIPIPAQKPALSKLRGGANGTVWVRPASPMLARDEVETVEWHVWRTDGRLDRIALLPTDFDLLTATDRYLIGVETNELGIEALVILEEE